MASSSAQTSGSGLFACQRIQAPTAVELCAYSTFTAPHHANLILAKTSVLEIYLVDQVRARVKMDAALLCILPSFSIADNLPHNRTTNEARVWRCTRACS